MGLFRSSGGMLPAGTRLEIPSERGDCGPSDALIRLPPMLTDAC